MSFQLLIENNIENLEKWLNIVAEENLAKAIDIIVKLSEYVLPKMNRTEFEANPNNFDLDLSHLTYEQLCSLVNKSDH